MKSNFLLVDDSKITRIILKKAIILSGIKFSKIYEASDGYSALEIIDNNKINLLITDINMPGMNGINLIKKIRKNSLSDSMKIIVISSHDCRKMVSELNDEFVDAYLEKPFMPEDIRDIIMEINEV